jgi:hypothetical protein
MQGGPELLQGLILVRASSDFHREDEQAFLLAASWHCPGERRQVVTPDSAFSNN